MYLKDHIIQTRSISLHHDGSSTPQTHKLDQNLIPQFMSCILQVHSFPSQSPPSSPPCKETLTYNSTVAGHIMLCMNTTVQVVFWFTYLCSAGAYSCTINSWLIKELQKRWEERLFLSCLNFTSLSFSYHLSARTKQLEFVTRSPPCRSHAVIVQC